MEMQVSVDGVAPNDITVKVLKPMLPSMRMLARPQIQGRFERRTRSLQPEEALAEIQTAKSWAFARRVLVLHDGTGQMQLNVESAGVVASSPRDGRALQESHYRDRILNEGTPPFKCRAVVATCTWTSMRHAWCSQTRGVFKKGAARIHGRRPPRPVLYEEERADACTIGCVRTQSATTSGRGQPNDFDAPSGCPS